MLLNPNDERNMEGKKNRFKFVKIEHVKLRYKIR